MTAPRTATFKVAKAFAFLVAIAVSCGSILPQAAFADFNLSSGGSASSLSLSGSTDAATDDVLKDVLSNDIKVLQKQLDAINKEINAGGTSDEIAQLRAVANALQAIIDKIKSGFTVEGYSVSTDAATLEATVTMSFVGDNDQKSVLTFVIPPISSDVDDDGTKTTDDDSSSDESDSPDLLTQILQQLGSQLSGGQNPFGNIQGMLNSLMSGTANPLQAVSGAVEEAAASALQCKLDGKTGAGNGVAVYDIAAGKVYMPDGTVLEAHSGLGSMMDNPAFVNQRNRGPTPPGVYTLSMRESLFHGTEAIRMTPAGGTEMYGRTGILAHPPLRRGSIGSAGCIAFANYNQFLNAFKQGQVKQIVVVPSVSEESKKCSQPIYNTPTPGTSTEGSPGESPETRTR